MFRFRVLAIAGCVLVTAALLGRAQDAADLKALLRKSIVAHGGEKNLAKFKAVQSKFKGAMELLGMTIPVVGETAFQKPDKVKNTLTLDINGKSIDVVTVYNGQKMWVSTMGKTQEIKDEKILNEVRDSMQIEGAGSLGDFLKEPYMLNSLGEVDVKGKKALGIRVSKKGQRDFSMFFDKQTNLVVKTEMRSLDAMTMQEVTQEKYITSYQDKEGMKIGKTVEILKDGKLFMKLEITEVQAFEKLDPQVFAMP